MTQPDDNLKSKKSSNHAFAVWTTKPISVGGVALMILGSAIVFGGFIVYFGNKSGHFVTFPYAGVMTLLAGTAVCSGGVLLSGRRGAIVFGTILSVAAVAMVVVGYPSDPPYRILVPLGVFVGFIGYLIIRLSLSITKEDLASEPDRSWNGESTDGR